MGGQQPSGLGSQGAASPGECWPSLRDSQAMGCRRAACLRAGRRERHARERVLRERDLTWAQGGPDGGQRERRCRPGGISGALARRRRHAAEASWPANGRRRTECRRVRAACLQPGGISHGGHVHSASGPGHAACERAGRRTVQHGGQPAGGLPDPFGPAGTVRSWASNPGPAGSRASPGTLSPIRPARIRPGSGQAGAGSWAATAEWRPGWTGHAAKQ